MISEKKIVGKYVDESSWTLAEWSKDHIDSANNFDYDSFIV